MMGHKKYLGLSAMIMVSLGSLSPLVLLLAATVVPSVKASVNSCAIMAYVTKKRCNRKVEDNNLILAQCLAQNCTSLVRQRRERTLLRAAPAALEEETKSVVTSTKKSRTTNNEQRNLNGPAPPTCQECIHHDCPTLPQYVEIPEWCELFCPFYNQGDCRREAAEEMEDAEWEEQEYDLEEEEEEEEELFDEDDEEAVMALFEEDDQEGLPTSRELTGWMELAVDEDHECIMEWYDNVHHSCYNNPGLTVMVRNCICDEDWV